MDANPFVTKRLSIDPDDTAPDGSLIPLLPSLPAGGMCHCTLPAGRISKAVRHQTVEEIWYCLSGRGVLWRRNVGQDAEVELAPGVGVTIPLGTHFQFRTSGDKDLVILIATMPPWPGAQEAASVPDHWPTS